MKQVVTIVFFAAFLFSCSKDNAEKDKELPVVTLMTPTSGQTFNAGENVNITAQLTDNKKITEVHLHISNNTTGALLTDIHRNPDAGTYTLNESFLAQAGIQYKIQVIAKDNSANENRATVEISSN